MIVEVAHAASLREHPQAEEDEHEGTGRQEEEQADVPEQAKVPGRTDGTGDLHGPPAIVKLTARPIHDSAMMEIMGLSVSAARGTSEIL